MVVIYCPAAATLAELRAAVPSALEPVCTTEREECLKAIKSAQRLVVAVAGRHDALPRWLKRGRSIPVTTPVTLVAHDDAEEIRRFGPVGADVTIWWRDVQHELGPAVERAVGSTLLGRTAHRLTTSQRIPPKLGNALSQACLSARPCLSVAGLARNVGVSRRHLQRLWRSVVSEPEYRLKDFLDWVLLIRLRIAQERRGTNRSTAVAVTERHEETVRRICHRLIASTISTVERQPVSKLAAAFRDRALKPLEAPDCRESR